jgi:hypothetical protein
VALEFPKGALEFPKEVLEHHLNELLKWN